MIYNYLCCEALSYYLSLKMFLKPKGFDICGLVSLRREDYSVDWWWPNVGCFREGVCGGEVWVRVLGLPMHL